MTLWVKGMSTRVRKQGMAYLLSIKLILDTFLIDDTPIMMRIGATADLGSDDKMGLKNIIRLKRDAHTREVNPVRPPAMIPELLSIISPRGGPFIPPPSTFINPTTIKMMRPFGMVPWLGSDRPALFISVGAIP